MKVEDWKTAEENWEIVFSKRRWRMGKRESQFWDGAEIMKWKLSQAKDDAEKKMIKDKIVGHLQTIYQLCHVGGILW